MDAVEALRAQGHLLGKAPESKLQKAQALGVKIIGEEALRQMCES